MILGGVETAAAFGLTVYVAKVIKDTIRHARAEKIAEAKRIADELKAGEPERLRLEEEDRIRRQKIYDEAREKANEQAKKDEAEAAIKAVEARKSAIPFADFETGYNCPKCGKAWRNPIATATQPQACNCSKCAGTHFHITCTGTATTNKGYSYHTIGCQAKFLMLAKDNTKES